MTDVKIPGKSWVVVCNGAKALIMQNAGDAQLMNLKVLETLTQPNAPDREVGATSLAAAMPPMGSAAALSKRRAGRNRPKLNF